MTSRTIIKSAILLIAGVGFGLLIGGTNPIRESTRLVAGEQPAQSEKNDSHDADRKAIKEATQAFLKAFESGDAKAVASHWTPEGEYTTDDGTTLRGRDAIEKAYTTLFAKKPKFEATFEELSIRFPSKDTAIQEGYFKVRSDKKEANSSSRYSILSVREDGKWLMAIVKEWPGEGESLRDLEWLIGSWITKREEREVVTTFSWDLNKSFLRMQFTIKDGKETITGMQMIGKDPTTGQLRSWVFESEGGFGHAEWTREGNKWIMEAEGISGDGNHLTATNLMIRLDDDTFTWQSTNRTQDEAELPDLPPVKTTRVKDKK
jgi:uncharacterized protein (TIGR02246 family)